MTGELLLEALNMDWRPIEQMNGEAMAEPLVVRPDSECGQRLAAHVAPLAVAVSSAHTWRLVALGAQIVLTVPHRIGTR